VEGQPSTKSSKSELPATKLGRKKSRFSKWASDKRPARDLDHVRNQVKIGYVTKKERKFSHDYVPIFMGDGFCSNGIVRAKTNPKFYDGLPTLRKQGLKVKLIDYMGNRSEHLLMLWRVNPYSLFATEVATTFKRLQYEYYKRSSVAKKERRKFSRYGRDHIFRLSVIKVILGSPTRRLDEVFKRLTPIHRILAVYRNKMDEPSRFLYSHACSHAEWLQHRGKPRAKSIRPPNSKEIATTHRVHTNVSLYCSNMIRIGILEWVNKNFLLAPSSIPSNELEAMKQASSSLPHEMLVGALERAH
jgi:hypothetical protein